ncbi:hypothetical protein HF325_000720 [Metschnikowia pulcherrima]|uniref:Alcohol acetyltransferase n=1 Tax=Metschnikowia pulcherrima TaxID=27326 RepID=A0A8H7LEX0_9ASCO|nr:hypothetical protein HF325_000720 [Metschnikowia pulcherrima]
MTFLWPFMKILPENLHEVITDEALCRGPEFMEKLFLYLERKNIFQSVSILVHINSKRQLTTGLVFAALRKLVLKYPLLFLFPTGDEPNITWVPLDKIRFTDVYEVNTDITECFKNENVETKVLNRLSISKRLRLQKPLWKLIYFKHTRWLTFQSAHSFTDGGSVIAYLKEFVESLNDLEEKESVELFFDLKKDRRFLKRGISPSFFSRIKYRPSLLTWLSAVALKAMVTVLPVIVPTFLETSLHNLFFVDRHPVPYSNRSFFESDYLISELSPLNDLKPFFVNIPPMDLKEIVGACRDHGVKLQTYIIIVYVHTVHELYPELYLKKFLKVGVPTLNVTTVFLALTNLGHVELLDHGSTGKYQIDDILFAPSSGAVLGTHHMTICSTAKNGLNIGFSDGDRKVIDWSEFRHLFKRNLLGCLYHE